VLDDDELDEPDVEEAVDVLDPLLDPPVPDPVLDELVDELESAVLVLSDELDDSLGVTAPARLSVR
jgi:hypothetical protein